MIGHILRCLTVDLRPRKPGAPTFEVFQGAKGWTWRERASNGKVAGAGGQGTLPYASKWNATRAAYKHAIRVEGSKVRILDGKSHDFPDE